MRPALTRRPDEPGLGAAVWVRQGRRMEPRAAVVSTVRAQRCASALAEHALEPETAEAVFAADGARGARERQAPGEPGRPDVPIRAKAAGGQMATKPERTGLAGELGTAAAALEL